MNVLQVLSTDHLLKIRTMNLQANEIGDDSLVELCDMLLQLHNTSIESLNLTETQIGDAGITMLVDTMKHIQTLHRVNVDSLKLSQPVREALEQQCLKNEVRFKERAHLGEMYTAAKKRDDYDEKGIGYYLE